MVIWSDLMGEYDSETKTYSAVAGGTSGAASPYTPLKSGRLKAVKLMIANNAATSLVCAVSVRLTCTTFDPNQIVVGIAGNGLMTATISQPNTITHVVDQKVTAGVPITVEAANFTADTPVTVGLLIYGVFEG